MEALEIAKSAGSLSGLGVIVLLALYALDKGWLKIFVGKNGNGADKDKPVPVDARLKADETPAWAERLMQYVNHDQTEKMEKLLTITENLAKGIERVHLKHDEWEKYGVPTRCIDEKK